MDRVRGFWGLPSIVPVVAVLAAVVLPVAGVAAGDGGETGKALVGVVSRQEVEAAEPDWVAAEIEARPDAEAALALTEVAPGAEVTVYLGTWCSDSERELARLWRAFDEVGVGMGTELPFSIEYVAVDRDKTEPARRLAGVGLEYVPTFVVRRDGEEVGRMVEVSPDGIEYALLDLLSGRATGVVSARQDLTGDAPASGDDGR